MIAPKMIPDEVVEAAAEEAWDRAKLWQEPSWHEISEERRKPIRSNCRAAIAAGLAAWPGAYKSDPALFGHKLILPLPQETRDE